MIKLITHRQSLNYFGSLSPNAGRRIPWSVWGPLVPSLWIDASLECDQWMHSTSGRRVACVTNAVEEDAGPKEIQVFDFFYPTMHGHDAGTVAFRPISNYGGGPPIFAEGILSGLPHVIATSACTVPYCGVLIDGDILLGCNVCFASVYPSEMFIRHCADLPQGDEIASFDILRLTS
jgi:hypothetical protein